MVLTEDQKNTLNTYLTIRVRKQLRAKIKKKLSKLNVKLSDRQINNILSGECGDNYGILNMAIKEAAFEKIRIQNLEKKIEALK